VNREQAIHDFMRARATRLRGEAMEHVVNRLWSSVATWIARGRGLLTAQPRALGH
jgi:hypothetical protein